MSKSDIIKQIVERYLQKRAEEKDKDLEDKELNLHKKPKLLPPRKDKHKHQIKEKDIDKNKDQYEKYNERYDY